MRKWKPGDGAENGILLSAEAPESAGRKESDVIILALLGVALLVGLVVVVIV